LSHSCLAKACFPKLWVCLCDPCVPLRPNRLLFCSICDQHPISGSPQIGRAVRPGTRGHCPRLQQKSRCPGTERPTRSASVLSVSFVRDPVEPFLSGQGLLPKIPGLPLRSLRSFAAKPTPLLFRLRSASHQRFASGWPSGQTGNAGSLPSPTALQSRMRGTDRRGQKLCPPCSAPITSVHADAPLRPCASMRRAIVPRYALSLGKGAGPVSDAAGVCLREVPG
jgi:hypothetical protein